MVDDSYGFRLTCDGSADSFWFGFRGGPFYLYALLTESKFSIGIQ